MFTQVAPRYDRAARWLSLGRDRQWKARAVRHLRGCGLCPYVLDLASGTGDLAWHLIDTGLRGTVVAVEPNARMLALALDKCAGLPVRFVRADLDHLPFRDGTFDVVLIGYGLRYAASIARLLTEVRRLLRPDGVFVALDLGRPRGLVRRSLLRAYLWVAGTVVGTCLHGRPSTYWHLPRSLAGYPGPHAIARWMLEGGFDQVRVEELALGAAAIVSGRRVLL